MKKTIKLFALIITVIIVCLTFCSCAQLDEERNNQAFYSQDDDSIIFFRDKTYKMLPHCEDLNTHTGLNGMITKHDVPVLLKDFYGNFFYYSSDLKFIDVGGEHYCSEDIFEEYSNKIFNYQLNNYCVDNFDYDYETDERIYEYKLLDPKAKELVDDVINNYEPAKPLGNEVYSKLLYLCDENTEFVRYYAGLIYTTDGVFIKVVDKSSDIYYKVDEANAPLLYPYLNINDTEVIY